MSTHSPTTMRPPDDDLAAYRPLLVVITLSLAAALARQLATAHPSVSGWSHDFMGFFLVIFAMFKLLDVGGFAKGFAMYDLLASRTRVWGYVYPFVELTLGLGYLSRLGAPWLYVATVVVMGFGAAGVIHALKRGLDVRCACLGTTLDVPLSTVAVVEDVGMAVMAAAMLATSWGG